MGRVLFYDKKLSIHNNISCGSCHKSASGFADATDKSIGFDGGKTKRNTPNIVNEVMNNILFWDGRESNLQKMVVMPVSNHIEMGLEKVDLLPSKLYRINYYSDLFTKAFGSSDITSYKISNALAQFVGSMFSSNTKFDIGEANNFSNFTTEELRGKVLFFDELPCSSCHNVSLLNANNFGGAPFIYTNSTITDIGLDSIPFEAKIPNLRNVALSAPYMHDGRFATLDDVINHYSKHIIANQNLDFRLRYHGQTSSILDSTVMLNNPIQFNLSQSDRKALLAFLNTLTDKSMITSAKFSDPFKK
ncbi:MAG: hypothetical protein RJA07_1339 [Bacteroidota bacterium]